MIKTDPHTQPSSGSNEARGRFDYLKVAGTCAAMAVVLVFFLLPVPSTSRAAAQRTQCKFNLKVIGLALHSYAEHYGGFPPAYTVDANGQRLHSWRTLILPYLEEGELYSELDLAKPWNDTHNLEVFHEHGMPGCYQCPATDLEPGQTTSMAIVGPASGLHPTESRRLGDFVDGTSNSLVVVEVPADQAVFWGQPDDVGREFFLGFKSESHLAHRLVVLGLYADASVQAFSPDMPLQQRRALLSFDGGEDLNQWSE